MKSCGSDRRMPPIQRTDHDVKLRRRVLNEYRTHTITLREAAQLLDVTYVEMDEIPREDHIPVAVDLPPRLRRPVPRKRR